MAEIPVMVEAELTRLRAENARLLTKRNGLQDEITALESALSERTRQLLGV